ncbi:MAG: hypothetical protein EZS28_023531 [Streblomastix strix]|uniref:Uncharacterized protein n=1 Tax=Streblomastix strix TaxID=222440 RepID=A0A5J4VEW8_9EUKA|nr:MAG: hypothetical protein EZS28_023531 [Streblomastix strix]
MAQSLQNKIKNLLLCKKNAQAQAAAASGQSAISVNTAFVQQTETTEKITTEIIQSLKLGPSIQQIFNGATDILSFGDVLLGEQREFTIVVSNTTDYTLRYHWDPVGTPDTQQGMYSKQAIAAIVQKKEEEFAELKNQRRDGDERAEDSNKSPFRVNHRFYLNPVISSFQTCYVRFASYLKKDTNSSTFSIPFEGKLLRRRLEKNPKTPSTSDLPCEDSDSDSLVDSGVLNSSEDLISIALTSIELSRKT